jgi:membrane-bound serine protease (ClpP class)
MVNNARLHSRNETIAQEFITKNINLGPEEALRYHVIEFAADTLQSLLSQLEPYTLILTPTGSGTSAWKLVMSNSIGGYTYTQSYDFSGMSQASSYTYNPGISIMLLQVVSNPLIATVLFLVGLYAVVIGFKTPGFGLEIAGGLMVFLALLGYGIIGINAAAILLFVLGIALTLIEIKTHIGIFALAGIGVIILGSFLAFPLPGWELLSAKAVTSARQTLVAVALVMSGMFGFVVYKVAQARRMKVKVGPEQFTGKMGIAVSVLSPRGEVRVEGQTWKAESVMGTVKEGESVEIVGREGLILRVKHQQTQT